MSTTLLDIRTRVEEAGHSLAHIDDRELLLRLDAMPQRAADSFPLACVWLVYAYLPPTPRGVPC